MPIKTVVIKGKYPEYKVDCVEVKDDEIGPGEPTYVRWIIDSDSDADLAKVCFSKTQWKYFKGDYEYAFEVKEGEPETRELDVSSSRGIVIELKYDIWCSKSGEDDVEAQEGASCGDTNASKRPRIRLRDVQGKVLTADYTATRLAIQLEQAADSSTVSIYDGEDQQATQAGPIKVITDFPSDIELQPGRYRAVLEEDGVADEEFILTVEAAPVVLVPIGAPHGNSSAGSGAAGA
jgi:hypothetical protein